ncbi:hypothetical protein Pcinc_001286 [Petrolisthes cinctipes]|uniref:Uncharacterized protein n=1 Tax=Petrolisthes cinctipes TaxID=88211 RepID=A0AAE1GRG5_PETCI|nr:hypothetical protein Pcinc_001286 [Petrolisthes cinctipes]
MQSVQPTTPRTPAHRTTYVPHDLQEAKEVFICRDHTKPPLQRPYEGPFPVVTRNDKIITVERKGHDYTASLDRVKAAHIPPDLQHTKLPILTQQIPLYHPSEFPPPSSVATKIRSNPPPAPKPNQPIPLSPPVPNPDPPLLQHILLTQTTPRPTTPTTTRQISTPAPNPLPYQHNPCIQPLSTPNLPTPPQQVLTNPPQPPHTPIHPTTQANHTLSDFNPKGTILHTGRRVR